MTEQVQPTTPLPTLSRRGLLGGLGLSSLAAVAAGISTATPAAATSEGTVLPLVDPLPAGAPARDLFAPEEQVFAAFVMIAAPLANSVVDDDPERFGWFEDGWQRTPNEPFNARIMEHVATLSWFYAHERPWNPYYLDEKLRDRLDAALGFYLGLQHSDGSWPEYSWDEHSLPSTGFGAVALSATLRDLIAADALPQRRAEIDAALRSASVWLLDTTQFHWRLPVKFTNQVAAGLAGVAQTAAVLGSPEIAADLGDRCRLLLDEGLSPAGFFNELWGFDAGYGYEVMLPDLGHIYEQTQDPSVVELARSWAEWLGHVVLMEPGQPTGFYIPSLSGRSGTTAFQGTPEDNLDRGALGRVFLAEVPELGAFYAPAEDKAAARAAWAASPSPVEPRQKQDSSPRLYMHVPNSPDGVTAAERDAQVAQLPYLVDPDHTILRHGTLDQQYVFVRRPDYYTAALFGVRGGPRQRMGHGIFWTPGAGTFVLPLNNTDALVLDWGAVTSDGKNMARSEVTVTHHAGGDATSAPIAADDVDGFSGVFTSRYATTDSAITTEVAHWHDGLRRTSRIAGDGVENIPLLLGSEDEVMFSDGTAAAFGATTSTSATGLTITRGPVILQVHWGEAAEVELVTTGKSYFDDTRRIHVLTIPFAQELTTELTAAQVAQVQAGRVACSVTSHVVAREHGNDLEIHAVNLDTVPVDVRVATSAGVHLFEDLAPGASGYHVLNGNRRPVRGTAVVRTKGAVPARVATRRLQD